MTSIRMGLIGLGRMGGRIAQIARQKGIQVVTALDPDPQPYAWGNSPWLADVTTADPQVFWSHPVDVIAISSTAPSHAPFLEEGVRRGCRRFLVEKPFATGLDEGIRALAMAEAAGARVVVNHGRRYSSNYQSLKQLDGSPEFGSLRSIVFTMGGGWFGCMGVHYFDLFNWFFGGQPERVCAALTQPQAPNPRGAMFDDPGGAALLLYSNGRRAHIDLADDMGMPYRLEFFYTYGRVTVEDDSQPFRLFHRRPEDRALPMTRQDMPLIERTLDGFTPQDTMPWTAAALDDVLSDAPLICGGDKGVDSLEVFAAIRWAAKNGGIASLPLPLEAAAERYAIP